MDLSDSISDPQAKTDKVKRGYRACLHCRSRKAKCDLGDIDAPSSPPCSRCKRESRECVFAESRRGGNNRKRTRVSEEDVDIKTDSRCLGQDERQQYGTPSDSRLDPPQTFPYPHPPPHMSPHLPKQSPQSKYYQHHLPNTGSSHSHLSPLTQSSTTHSPPPKTYTHASNTQNPRGSPKRHRLHLNPPLHAADPSSIVVADMQNESDALQILALASGQAAKGEKGQARVVRRNESDTRLPRHTSELSNPRNTSQAPELENFPLIRLGILTPEETMRLTDQFFRCHHHLFPMVPSAIIPRTLEQLAVFAKKERYLLAAYIVIASRPDSSPRMRLIHEKSWIVMRGWISDVQCLGAPPAIGFVEALLLLAENLPRTPSLSGPEELAALGCREEPHGDENRQAWQMIGLAVRSAYEMGLDKIALSLLPENERTLEIERARLAWTYCYLFDRHVSIRLGKGFWARGAAVCFQGFSSSAQTGPVAGYAHFPFLREIKNGSADEHPQEDLGGLVQAYLELTQLMSNAHDVLYPNSARTRSLVIHGEYFKYLDEMARSLDAFKLLWRSKKWTLFPLTDAMWTMFYYVQLYICAFSFQAHVERATNRAEEEYRRLQQAQREKGDDTPLARPTLSLFPRGAAQSPDARYIFHMCDTARELLLICVDNLYPGGALPYLPSRFLLWFTYGAIVLLKALYSGAMLKGDHKPTLDLIDRLCECFGSCSKDDDHPAVRYGRQLEALRKKLAVLSDTSGARSPTGGRTLPPVYPSTEKPGVNTNWDGSEPYKSRSNTRSSRPSVAPGDSGPPSTFDGYGNTPGGWQMPPAEVQSQPIVFPYPTTPSNGAAGSHYPQHPSYAPMSSAFIAPHTQQPLINDGILQHPDHGFSLDMRGMGPGADDNVPFGSTDDWFGSVGLAGPGTGNGTTGQDDGIGPLGGLDLQDFWMQVGPGEAQGGFPFR